MLSPVGATSWLEEEGVPDASVSDVKERREEPRREKKPLREGESESVRGMEKTSPVP